VFGTLFLPIREKVVTKTNLATLYRQGGLSVRPDSIGVTVGPCQRSRRRLGLIPLGFIVDAIGAIRAGRRRLGGHETPTDLSGP
jgi:hypothetical protein